jgi:hypothetical protein
MRDSSASLALARTVSPLATRRPVPANRRLAAGLAAVRHMKQAYKFATGLLQVPLCFHLFKALDQSESHHPLWLPKLKAKRPRRGRFYSAIVCERRKFARVLRR